MSFDLESQKRSSERFALVRLTLTRYFSPSAIGGGLYAYTTFHKVTGIYVNGVGYLTKVSVPTEGNEYSFDEATGVITLFGDYSLTLAVMFFQELFSTGKDRSFFEDPLDSSTRLLNWRGCLSDSITFSESIENIETGLEISSSEVSFFNNGRYSYLSQKAYSLKNGTCEAWFFINGVGRKMFSGSLGNMSSSESGIISIQVFKEFKNLDEVASFGDSTYGTFLIVGTLSLRDEDIGKFIPVATSKVSREGEKYSFVSTDEIGAKAILTDYDPETISSTTNRNFLLCKVFDVLDFSCTPSSFGNLGSSYTINMSEEEAKKFMVDDFFVMGTSSIFVVTAVLETSIVANLWGGSTAPTAGDSIAQNYVSALYLNGVPLDPTQFTQSYVSTSNNNKIVFVELTDAGITFDPSQDVLTYRVRCPDLKDGDLFKKICDSIGLEYEAAYVENFSSSNYVACSCLPFPNQDEPRYRDVLTNLFNSFASYFYTLENGKYGYRSFDSSITTPDFVISQSDIVRDSYSESIQDLDSTYSINFERVFDRRRTLKEKIVENPNAIEETSIKDVRTCYRSDVYELFPDEPNTSGAQLNQYFYKKTKIAFSTKTKGNLLKLGDLLEIQKKDGTTKLCHVVKLEGSPYSVSVTASDQFLGVLT